jgi:nitrogenase molybdenum-iron protein alpha/beta subunit
MRGKGGISMSLKSYEHCCSSLQALATLGKVEGVIPLLHGPQPCAYQIQIGTMACRPSRLITAGTLIKKSEVVFGGEENLKSQIINMYHQYKPRIIVIINTCLPQIIGEDIKGVIAELEREIPELKVTYFDSGFNFPKSMPLGNDMAWVSIVRLLESKEKVKGSVGLVGRSGADSGAFQSIDTFLKEAEIPVFIFPAANLSEMERIVQAEMLFPIHVVPYLTCKEMSERFGAKVKYLEIPSGIQGTSGFLRGVADIMKNQKLHDLVDQEEEKIRSRYEAIRKQFAEDPVKVMIAYGPASEFSLSKIFADFGAEVIMIPSMKNRFAQMEKELQKKRYGLTILEDDFNTLEDLYELYKPDAVFCETQGRVEFIPKLMPAFCNMMYLTTYGYQFALDFGENFHKAMKRGVLANWKDLVKRYGGMIHS